MADCNRCRRRHAGRNYKRGTGGPLSFSVTVTQNGTTAPIPPLDSLLLTANAGADGRQLFLYTAYRMPATLYKVDAASGLKQKWREFTPSDPAGATTLYAVFLSADTKAGVYSFQRPESSLKLMEGLR